MSDELTRAQVDQMKGDVLLNFGASWCPICQGFAPQLRELLLKYPDVKHVQIEDGPGKRLGRSFRVKLWPNLVFMKDGKMLEQFARPDIEEVEGALQKFAHKA